MLTRGIRPSLLAALLLLCAAPFAVAAPQGAGEEGEEEEFYRKQDPDERPPPVDLVRHAFTLGTRFFQGMGGDADLKQSDLALALNLQYLWSPFSDSVPVRFEFGAEGGWIDQHDYDSGGHTPQTIAEFQRDLEPGLVTTPVTPVNDVIAETEIFYLGPSMRLDFMGPSSFDVGITSSFLFAQVATDAVWFCTDCTGSSGGASNESVDSTVTTAVIRFGAFFAWQYEWFSVGADLGFTYWQKNKLPMRFGVDFGVSFGVGF